MKKPDKCCEVGTYEHQIPMPVKGRVRHIDFCIARLVAALEAANMEPEASCCGHGVLPPSVILSDDTWLLVLNRERALDVVRQSDSRWKVGDKFICEKDHFTKGWVWTVVDIKGTHLTAENKKGDSVGVEIAGVMKI